MAYDDPSGRFQSFFQEALERAIPLSVHWDLTWRCDHKCVHCYLVDRHQDELTLAEGVGILDQLAAAGVMSILFSGGDPFLRPDAVDFMEAARARDFDVKINSHGNFIDDALADRLAAMQVHRVALSVYSDEAADHEAVTLIPGSHQKTLDAARRLVARGVKVAFKTPVMLHNRGSWHRVGAVAEAIGATWEIDGHIVPDDESDFGLCQIGVHPTERILALLHAARDRVAEAAPLDQLPDTPSDRRTCSAGTVSGYISPDGRLYACINWREPIGDLRTTPFETLWHHNPEADRLRAIRRATYLQDCDGCTFHTKCNYCPGLSHAETGDAGRRSPYVCERTHVTMSAMEHLHRLREAGQPVPAPGTPEAAALFDAPPTFADRQWAARRAGMARPADRLAPGLVTITEPTRR
ncbi:MAG: radical SAM protein [Myxococcales bacterium]|nr:radical SAM protein [Myxococcales bacterium]